MKKKKWFLAGNSVKRADIIRLAKECGCSPITMKCILNRGVAIENVDKFLNGNANMLYAPERLLNAELAAKELKDAIDGKKKIRVIGDYDVDGETSTTILVKGIKKCGGDVDYAVPDRIIDGYGLNDNLINNAYRDGVQVIITCDNGIAAAQQIETANKLGIVTIVTDHHEVPYINKEDGTREYLIPNAKVVVDPKQEGETYPQHGICGAVVAFKVITLLYKFYNIPNVELEELIMYAALGTVCDVMELVDENRLLVKEGLRIINTRGKEEFIGMKALIEACGLAEKTITSGHFGFVLGPTCNAAGRLRSANLAIELFFETDIEAARVKAKQLRDINEARKNMTESKTAVAIEMIETTSLKDDKILLIKLDECHESIAGIIAGRIKERYCQPTVVFTDAHDGGIKGSGRSIEAYNMFEEFNKHRDAFVKFGGHAMAAGMSLASMDDLAKLRAILNEESTLTEEDFCEITRLDLELPIEQVDIKLAKELSMLEPFGVGNAAPLFAVRDLAIILMEELGENHNSMKYHVKTKDGHYGFVFDFGDIDKFIGHLREKYGNEAVESILTSNKAEHKKLPNENSGIVETISYKVGVNVYKGNESPQIVLGNYK